MLEVAQFPACSKAMSLLIQVAYCYCLLATGIPLVRGLDVALRDDKWLWAVWHCPACADLDCLPLSERPDAITLKTPGCQEIAIGKFVDADVSGAANPLLEYSESVHEYQS